jgi:poly-gamma-glutamate capsule biosynthesis protein CapA/YwtB (metallophosphatase superfamily)
MRVRRRKRDPRERPWSPWPPQLSSTGVALTIALLGDVMLGRGVAATLDSRPPESVWSPELRELTQRCDAVICNLECCISARGSQTARIRGKPFFFRAPPIAVDSLGALGVCAVSLANNHALDFEVDALDDTVGLLDARGIATVGAGLGPSPARQGAVVTTSGGRIGLLGLADHPREYAASPDEWGIAYADLDRGLPEWASAELQRLAERADVVIAFPHWGPNMVPSPARWQRRRAAEMLDAGATLVAGHSAHVFHGVELVGERFAVYDLGDALDDYAVNKVLRNDRGLVALWRPGGDPELELVGLQLDYARTDVAAGEAADWIADRLTRACGELGTAIERTSESTFAVRPNL